jgi:hypothetical protein
MTGSLFVRETTVEVSDEEGASGLKLETREDEVVGCEGGVESGFNAEATNEKIVLRHMITKHERKMERKRI